jgi:hypothetical protein
MTNVKICTDNGIKKIFLINHHVDVEDLLKCACMVKVKYPELWVGVNMLGVLATEAIAKKLTGIDGLWCDESLSREDIVNHRVFKGLIFSGLAFKYQPQPEDLEKACKDIIRANVVATTSGIATGKAVDIEKIKLISKYIGNNPIAIASGVSIDNVNDYIGLVDYLLVASSITSKGEMIFEDKLKELIKAVKNKNGLSRYANAEIDKSKYLQFKNSENVHNENVVFVPWTIRTVKTITEGADGRHEIWHIHGLERLKYQFREFLHKMKIIKIKYL